MPFVRFSRDRRGYEHTYLVHESGGRGRPTRARVLYWFRTPPGIKVGREPFDEEARRRIESQNPGLAFDWNTIASTPMPPVPEVEHWRERRRAERAAKVARREDETDASIEAADAEGETPSGGTPAQSAPVVAVELAGAGPETGGVSPPETEPPPQEGSLPRGSDNQARKRRRRRGGRRRQVTDNPVASSGGDESLDPDAPPARAEPDFHLTEPVSSPGTFEAGPSTPLPSETPGGTSQE